MKSDRNAAGGTLRSGFTTGACAAAAARAAAASLTAQKPVTAVSVTLGNGCRTVFAVAECRWQAEYAICSVIKDAGDDPDITHGAVIKARVERGNKPEIELCGGPGVGTITRPGLEVPVGEPAINPGPRRMITDAVNEFATGDGELPGLKVTISIDNGEKLALHTLNPRLGIIGGLSVLGTTGIVIPYSLDAYKASIPQAVGVAAACGCRRIVLTTGRRTEKFAQAFEKLDEPAFVLTGDFMDEALIACVARGIGQADIWCMPGKASKLAARQINTHFTKSDVDIPLLLGLASETGVSGPVLDSLRETVMANEFLARLPQDRSEAFCRLLARRAADACEWFTREQVEVRCIICDYEGKVMGRSDE